MRTATIAWAAASAAALGLGVAAVAPMLGGSDAFADCRGGQVAGGDLGGPFTLVDAGGATVTDAEVFTAPSILYFGYTYCPDVCPLDAARNAEATRLLEERGILATPVMVSIDPARDTPEVMGRFAANFHERMVGLTGSEAQVADAARAWRVYSARQEGDPLDYLVDHSAFSYLVLPGTGFVDVVSRDEPPEAVADRLACFVEAAA